MKKLLTAFAIILLSVTVTASAAGKFDGEPEGTFDLTVIHGIAGLPMPVEVFVNGDFAFAFDFNESVGPLALPAGDYLFEVKLDGATVLDADVTLGEGMNYTAIAHETFIDGVDSGIKLSLFENNTSSLANDKIRLTVRHTADAPAVDAALLRGWWLRWFVTKGIDISNADDAMPTQFGPADYYRGVLSALLLPTGTSDVVFDSGRNFYQGGKSYTVYAIGSIFDGTFTLFVQTIDL